MLYMWKTINGTTHIYRAGGMTMGEEQLAISTGWALFWTTDKDAHRDGMRLAAKAARASKAVAR